MPFYFPLMNGLTDFLSSEMMLLGRHKFEYVYLATLTSWKLTLSCSTCQYQIIQVAKIIFIVQKKVRKYQLNIRIGPKMYQIQLEVLSVKFYMAISCHCIAASM